MASLQDEFPELTQKIFDALRPISDIAHGDSGQVVASVVLSSVRSAFLVLLQQDLIYSGDEAKAVPADVDAPKGMAEPVETVAPSTIPLGVMETDLGPADGNGVADPVTAVVDAGTLDEPVTSAGDLGSVEPEPTMPPSVPLEPVTAEALPPSDQPTQPATPEPQS